MNNLDLMKRRAQYANNDRQHDRMVQDKLKTLYRALLYSYQAAWIKKDNSENAEYVRSLINPDRVKFDYDEKILSVPFESNFHCGDTFEWKGTDSHWIILKQEMTERAYFRGNCRRCQSLTFTDPETQEEIILWGAVRGPVETDIQTIQKAGIVADVPNRSLHVYVSKNEMTERLCKRYYKFFFAGETWEISSHDAISTPGIIDFSAIENFKCDSDTEIKKDPNPIVPSSKPHIEGPVFVKPISSITYRIEPSNMGGEWSVSLPAEKNRAIKDVLEWSVNDCNEITVKWLQMISGSYILKYGSLEKTIVVESLF